MNDALKEQLRSLLEAMGVALNDDAADGVSILKAAANACYWGGYLLGSFRRGNLQAYMGVQVNIESSEDDDGEAV